MAWLKSCRELERHPKVLMLEQLTGLDRNGSIGVLHRFWFWCMDYAEDGRLEKWPIEVISKALGIDANHLVTAGFIDTLPELRVHDWWDYVGDYLRAKYRLKPDKLEAIKRYWSGNSPEIARSKTEQDEMRGEEIKKDICQPGPNASGPTPEDLIKLWNKKAHPNLPRVALLTETRKRHAKARLQEHPEQKFWDELINQVNFSPLLRGERGDWKATFDWILNPQNLAKVVEGNYNEKRVLNGTH